MIQGQIEIQFSSLKVILVMLGLNLVENRFNSSHKYVAATLEFTKIGVRRSNFMIVDSSFKCVG